MHKRNINQSIDDIQLGAHYAAKQSIPAPPSSGLPFVMLCLISCPAVLQ